MTPDAPTDASRERAGDAAGPFPGAVDGALWIFALFLVVRIFSASPFLEVSGDACKYLVLGWNFPSHALWNDEVFLLHPPPLGWSIGIFALVLPLLAAGLSSSLFWAAVAFWALRGYARGNGLPRSGVLLALLVFSLNRTAISWDAQVARVSILQAATALSLFSFERLLETGRGRVRAALLAAFCLFTSDQALALLPALAVIFLIDRRRGRWPDLGYVLSVGALAYLVWPVVRLSVYLTRPDFPAGIDGVIEDLERFPLKAVFQPNFLPETWTHISEFAPVSLSLGALKLVRFGTVAPQVCFLEPWGGRILTGGLLAIAGIAGAWRRDRTIVKLFLVSLLFHGPILLGWPAWYGLGFLLPFSVLIGKAFSAVPAGGRLDGFLASGLGAAALLLALLWVAGPRLAGGDNGGPIPIFAREPVTKGERTLGALKNLPADEGIMAPIGLAPEAALLTRRRVIGLPLDPARLEAQIRGYRIGAILLTDFELHSSGDPNVDRARHRDVARFITGHPETFRLVREVVETYPAIFPPRRFYLVEPVRRKGTGPAE